MMNRESTNIHYPDLKSLLNVYLTLNTTNYIFNVTFNVPIFFDEMTLS